LAGVASWLAGVVSRLTRQPVDLTIHRIQEQRMPFARPLSAVAAAFLFLLPVAGAQTDSWVDRLRVSFIDVGQGDAILIQGPANSDGSPGTNVLIDGGPHQGVSNRVPLYTTTYGLPPGSTLDFVVLTHPHDDHYKGLLDVLDVYDVRTIIDAGYPKGGKYDQFVQKARAELADGAPATFIQLRQTGAVSLDWGDKLEAEILWSDREDLSGMGSKNTRENNASTVIRLVFGQFAFLFMGDAEGKDRKQPDTTLRYVEARLLETFDLSKLKATVLKAGHHGSETGSTLAFIKAVQPDIVVVMSGRRSFGGRHLPDETVLQRITTHVPGVTILRTDHLDEEEGLKPPADADGDDIFMFTDGQTLRAFQARGEPRAWERIRVIP
jgi:competence protein ComEC